MGYRLNPYAPRTALFPLLPNLRPLEPIPPRIGIEPGTLPLSFEVSLWNRIEVPAGIRALLKSGEIRFPKKCVAESTLVSWRSFLHDDFRLTAPILSPGLVSVRLCRLPSFGSVAQFQCVPTVPEMPSSAVDPDEITVTLPSP